MSTAKGTGKGGAHQPAVVSIDPTLARGVEDFPESAKAGAQSPWRAELSRMVDLANEGEVEIGKYYLVGKFNSANGAATRKSLLDDSKLPVLLLYLFDFKTLNPTPTTSELWVAIVHRTDWPAARTATLDSSPNVLTRVDI